jgi:4-hydroxy-tetrahydrodipicolinate synthase
MRSQETYKKYTGLGVAITTPFKNGKVDFHNLERLLHHKIDNGVDYIVALGSTGEGNLLSEKEQKEILKFVVEQVDKRVPVVAGNLSDIYTSDVIDKIAEFDLTGLDSLMISAPSYVKPPQEGMYQHFMAIAEESPLPIIIYNVPGRTRSNLEWQTSTRLAKDSDVFIGLKEAAGDLIQTIHITKNKPKDFFVASGDDELALAMMANGVEGLISVIGNAYPAETKQMIDRALKDNYKEAVKYQHELFSIYHWIYNEGNPAGIKAACELLGFGSKEVRLPLMPLSQVSYDQLDEGMKYIAPRFDVL